MTWSRMTFNRGLTPGRPPPLLFFKQTLFNFSLCFAFAIKYVSMCNNCFEWFIVLTVACLYDGFEVIDAGCDD